jgi:hypothetical protein
MMKLAIIGGGPAGLSLAKILENEAAVTATVFEAGERPGGKSLTIQPGRAPIEMGTCYLTASHRRVLRWMKDQGTPLRPLGEQLFDGADVIRYIRRGSGPSMPLQVISYLRERGALLRRLEWPSPPQSTLDEAAMPAREWLERRGLGKMVRLMQRAVTTLGYGYLERIPTVHALRWVDRELIVSGMLKQLKMPTTGWTDFWQELSRDFDLRLDARVDAISRNDTGVTIHHGGESEQFDAVACAMPVDEFMALLDEPSELEREISEAIVWGRLAITLIAADGWFRDHPVEAWSDALVPQSRAGRLLSARYEGHDPELGGHLYITGQYGNGLEPDEAVEILRGELAAFGARITNVIMHRTWKYMATYAPHAIRSGLIAKMRAVQGRNLTFYTGAAFSHESVSNITDFNARLSRDILDAASRGFGQPALDIAAE